MHNLLNKLYNIIKCRSLCLYTLDNANNVLRAQQLGLF